VAVLSAVVFQVEGPGFDEKLDATNYSGLATLVGTLAFQYSTLRNKWVVM
ncbi:jg2115, partial [Pararge aegeria aegeria]